MIWVADAAESVVRIGQNHVVGRAVKGSDGNFRVPEHKAPESSQVCRLWCLLNRSFYLVLDYLHLLQSRGKGLICYLLAFQSYLSLLNSLVFS